MDKELEKLFMNRVKEDKCVIYGKMSNNKIPSIVVTHYRFGKVMVCENHIQKP